MSLSQNANPCFPAGKFVKYSGGTPIFAGGPVVLLKFENTTGNLNETKPPKHMLRNQLVWQL